MTHNMIDEWVERIGMANQELKERMVLAWMFWSSATSLMPNEAVLCSRNVYRDGNMVAEWWIEAKPSDIRRDIK